MGEIAMRYLAEGRSVFPICTPTRPGHCLQHGACKSPGKTPLLEWGHYQDERPSAEEVTRWWTWWPEANIAMATGVVSGVDVLDADSGEAKARVLEQGITPGPVVYTGKIGGVHWHLAYPGEPLRNFAGRWPGLDFRGDGGYVLLPPSLHENGVRYRWAEDTEDLEPAPFPAWLRQLFVAGPSLNGTAGGSHVDLDLVLDGVPHGQRDDVLYRFACKLRADDVPIGYARLLLQQSARLCHPPFEEVLALEKVERAYREFQPDPVLEIPAGGLQESDYPLWSLEELIESAPTETVQVIEGLLWANRTTWVFGDPGCGKTFFLAAALLHVAAGASFADRPTLQQPVLWIEEDSPLSILADYAATLADIYGLSLTGLPFTVNRTQGLRLMDDAGINRAKRLVEDWGQTGCVAWDACERLVPSERFTSRELDPLYQFFLWLIARGNTIFMIDHTNKLAGEAAKGVSVLNRLYGGRPKSAICDAMLYMGGDPKAGITAHYAKFRGDVPPPFAISFSPEAGFRIQDRPSKTMTPTEHKLMGFFGKQPDGWYALEHILSTSGVPDRSGRRALDALAVRRWLLKRGGTKIGTEYRANPGLPGAFD